MDEQSRQIRYLVVIAAVICAVMIGYNAFYVPDAPLLEPSVTADASASEEYTPSPVTSKGFSVSSGSSRLSSKTTSKKAGKVNINTATAQELSDGLNGVGEGLAERIVAYRKQHGAFQSIEQIKNVSGIGDKKYEAICSSITVQ